MSLQHKSLSFNNKCKRFSLKLIEIIRPSKCCFVFTLRQGTIMIAIAELSLTSIVLFLLLLAAMNTQEIVSIVASEIQALESNWSMGVGDKSESHFYYIINEKKMLTGQHLARIMMNATYTGVVASIIHIISCSMLLYGALRNISNFMLPWLSTVLIWISFFSLLFFSLITLRYYEGMILLLAGGIISLEIEKYAWLVVFTYYTEILNKNFHQGVENILSPDEKINNMKTII